MFAVESASTQYALNIASEFFEVNDIFINSEKTVAIPINQGVKVASLSICEQSILIAKKGKAHRYLGIFLSTEGLSKPSIAKAYADVCFFVNVVFRKTITDKQFLYLVSAVLQPIGLRSKACLLYDFSDAALHHPSLYDLKLFEQVQFEGKVAALIMFFNASGILGHLWLVGLKNFLPLEEIGSMWFCVSLLCGLNVLKFSEFFAIKDGLHNVWSDFFEVYTDKSLKNAGSAEVASGATAYFLALDLSIGVVVWGFLSSIMAELQAVALSLKYVPSFSTVVLYLNSQAAINACISEMSFVTPNFHNQCWLERRYIFNLVRDKDLNMSWAKIKGHSGISGNVRANLAAGAASGSPSLLLANMCEHFLVAKNTAVSDNARHFV
ncbi:hypothetical protein G9A89_005916 [Geosiphon pyriformis]|nr:hypothetical protein G9A89_005916 [Geosiphon pyriformis]